MIILTTLFCFHHIPVLDLVSVQVELVAYFLNYLFAFFFLCVVLLCGMSLFFITMFVSQPKSFVTPSDSCENPAAVYDEIVLLYLSLEF